MESSLLEGYRQGLVRMSLTHTWRGAGSAIFFEFGALTQRTRRDGSTGQPQGELSAMIEWSWRVEGGSSIIFGSWSDDTVWESVLLQLRGSTVTNLEVFGKLPELVIELSNGRRIVSFMTSDGDPSWALFDRRSTPTKWLRVRDGNLVEESAAQDR